MEGWAGSMASQHEHLCAILVFNYTCIISQKFKKREKKFQKYSFRDERDFFLM